MDVDSQSSAARVLHSWTSSNVPRLMFTGFFLHRNNVYPYQSESSIFLLGYYNTIPINY